MEIDMAFKPNLNTIYNKPKTEQTVLDIFQQAQTSKNLVQEITEKQAVNHKSNVYKILFSNPSLTKEDAEILTVLIDQYYSKYLK